jgi:hypothetical protein
MLYLHPKLSGLLLTTCAIHVGRMDMSRLRRLPLAISHPWLLVVWYEYRNVQVHSSRHDVQ